ncbi:MAG TPA: molybdenum cofactor biosynthesis protein MoaE [Tepidisphaeraceae bacterium]|jgi:molybdopterin synthase catalytic subunit|nr:molybdenum cofactor biosynthesis protein MoaE [Tepidisphaeraceae bacterium]
MMDETVKDWVKLTIDPLDVAGVVDFVCDPVAGGVDLFLGTTRREGELEALEYEAYDRMAVGQMLELARRARERWPVVKCAIHHRVGRVAVGEVSVAIAVSAGHRAEAFEACRWLIDTLKEEVAVWKKEIWADGTGTWVNPSQKSEVRGQKTEEAGQT